MPEGLLYALSAKFSSDGLPRVSTISGEGASSMYMQEYIQETLNNCLEITEGSKPHIHLILLANDIKEFDIPESRRHDLTVYNYTTHPSLTIRNLHESFVNNVASKPERSHLMIIDDFSIFSILMAARSVDFITDYLKKVLRKVRKLFIFFNKECLSTEEISVLYSLSTDIAYLQDCTGGLGGNSGTKRFICDLLKIRTDRRVAHDRTVFQLTNDGIKEELVRDSNAKDDSNIHEVFKTLTTFKLTLEDDERESKNKLHLPYFEAQKTSLEDPSNDDEYEDEEDEEV